MLLAVFMAGWTTSGQVPSPESHFGFIPGTDRMLFDYEQLISYLQKADAASPKLKLVEIGHSPLGKPIFIAFISSAGNIERLDELKEINRTLALDSGITRPEMDRLVHEGRVFLLATLSMHATEVAPSQSAPLIAYELITSDDPDVKNWLEKVVYMMVPCHNPDGMDMIVGHYLKYKGTQFEGASFPGLYHVYAGHDNNRDFIALTQPDTRAIAAIYNKEWFPQVMVEKHQMGATGVRYYVPPPHDPIAENIDAGIWNWMGVFGLNMMKDMTGAGLKGIARQYLFDDYWPGSTETCIWKNVIGMLTEGASVKMATPVYIEPSEIQVWGKGLSEYEKSINMPELWPGGWWRLGDLVAYERASTLSMIRTAAANHDEILRFRNEICCREVDRGLSQPPYYYIVPRQEQHDQGEMVKLVNLMMEHGIRVYTVVQETKLNEITLGRGDMVIPLAQPFRAFIKEVMEKQRYPLRHYTPGGEIIRPYDVTSWSLPLHNGVRSIEVNSPYSKMMDVLEPVKAPFELKEGLRGDFWGMAFSANNNESYAAAFRAVALGFKVDRLTRPLEHNRIILPAGSFIIYGLNKPGPMEDLYGHLTVDPVYIEEKPQYDGAPLQIPRIALVETFMHDMDAGWTRFLFDSYGLPYRVIRPAEIQDTDLAGSFDVIVFPSVSKDLLKEGKYKPDKEEDYYLLDYPPEFTKGMGTKGLEQVLKFINGGGTVISWGGSTGLFTGPLSIKSGEETVEEFQLPFSDVASRQKGLYVPGSLLKLQLKPDHPLTLGMPAETAIFYRGKPLFATEVPDFDMDRRIIGSFPEEDILLSGYSEQEELLAQKSAIIWLKKGRGQLVLFAFSPQFRASTGAGYKLLFNAVLLPDI